MAIIGAFARVERSGFDETIGVLDTLDGVSTFELDDPDKIGLLIETPGLDEAHQILTGRVRAVPGVLGVWPAYANIEDETNQPTPV